MDFIPHDTEMLAGELIGLSVDEVDFEQQIARKVITLTTFRSETTSGEK